MTKVPLIIGSLIIAGGVTFALATTQAPSTTDAIRAAADTLLMEACRGGKLSASMLTCTGSNLTPRKGEIRRLAFTIRTLANQIDLDTVFVHDTVLVPDPATPPATPIGACTPATCPSYAIQLYTNSDSMWYPNPGVDTVTMCAVVEGPAGGPTLAKRIAWPPVRFRITPNGDSLVSWGERGGNPLTSMCARALVAAGLESTDSVLVTWTPIWFDYRGKRLWRPLAAVRD